MDNNNEEILLRVGLDTVSAEQSAVNLKAKIQAVGDTPINDTPVKGYKAAIRDLTAQLQILERTQGRNSQAFRDGVTQLGKLKLAAQDFKDVVENFNPANKFAGIANIAKGAAVGMTGAAGAMAIFGVKGEKAEEVMLRLQGILALSHAISSIHELTSGWNSFLTLLGFNAKNVQTLTTAQQEAYAASQAAKTAGAATAEAEVVAVQATTEATVVQISATERLAAAKTELAEITVEGEAALAAARAEGLDATVAMTGAEQAYLELMTAKSAALLELTAAQTAYNEAVLVGTENVVAQGEANVAEAITTEAVVVAEEAATVASVGFGTALKFLGIGLLITALAYLVSNWKELKASISDLFPVLSQGKSIFKEFQNDILGVGSAVIHILKAPIDQAITTIKILWDLLKLDFKGAAKDFKDGINQQLDDFNVLANFKAGKAKAEAKDAAEANKKRVEAEIDANERIIKERKALGQNTSALEVKNQQLKNSQLDKDADDYAKKLADGQSEITVIQNTEIKKRNDAAEKLRKEAEQKALAAQKAAEAKAAAAKKAELDKLKAGNDEAAKVIQGGLRSQRDIELSDADFKYNKLLAIAKKYGQSSSQLEEALGIQKAQINKKYADEISEYLNKTDDENLNEFNKKRKDILADAQKALKNADPEEAAVINRNKDYLLARTDKEEQVTSKANDADVNLTATETANRAGVGRVPDSPEVQFSKEEAIRNAKELALKANYEKEQFLAQGNADKLNEINANFQRDSAALEDEGTKAKIQLSDLEREQKLKNLSAIGNALGAFGEIAGKQTAAGKVLGVAQATISTYIAASQTLADPTLPFFAKAFAVAGTIAVGLAQVKNILAVKVPGTSGSGASAPTYSAPTINSTVLNQAQAGIQQVQVVNQKETEQEPIKAYVVEKDITSKQDRAAYLNRQSTI
ncbi:MAG: hypothetical protein V4520_02430 [Bacteroidota bacterium]